MITIQMANLSERREGRKNHSNRALLLQLILPQDPKKLLPPHNVAIFKKLLDRLQGGTGVCHAGRGT